MVARVDLHRPISDEELTRIGQENPGWKVELVDGAIQMVPTGFESGLQNMRLGAFVYAWATEHDYLATESSTGYKVRNHDVLSPDVALVAKSRVATLTAAQRKSYCPLVPDVVIELASKSDSHQAVRRKCERWHRDGAHYVVLIDPDGGSEEWGDPPPEFPDLSALLDVTINEP